MPRALAVGSTRVTNVRVWFQGKGDRLRVLASRQRKKRLPASSPRVSIIIPTLPERLPLLRSRAIVSILAQTENSFEVLIITDQFDPAIASEIRSLDSRFRYLWGARVPRALKLAPALSKWCSAATPALNKGLAHAAGDFIARLDDDDSWHPLHLATSIQALEKEKLEFISSASILPDGSKNPDYRLTDEYYSPQKPPRFPSEKVGSPITWVYSRHLAIVRYSTWSWRLTHNRPADINLSLRLWRAGVAMGYLETIGAYVGLRDNKSSWGLKAFLEDNEGDKQ